MSKKAMAKKKKRERLRNKRLIKKYGNWIRPRQWGRYGWKEDFADDYATEYDAFNKGWGMLWRMMLNDINPLIHKYNLQDTFFFEQIKEKYGELCIYHNGAPKEIDDIINAYCFISSNVCQWCGRPDSAVSKGGWVNCKCKKCFEAYCKNHECNKKYEECYNTDPKSSQIPNVRKVRRFSTDGYVDIEYDIKDIVDRYRSKWYNKHKEAAMNGNK